MEKNEITESAYADAKRRLQELRIAAARRELTDAECDELDAMFEIVKTYEA